MALLVIRSGGFTTVQDRGRVGYRRFGVPVAGAADQGAFRLANALLGNSPNCAALELTLYGGAYRAEVDLAVALTGAPLVVTVEPAEGATRRWSIPQTGTLRAGETLILGGSPTGARAYLAVRGGWQTSLILGSRSSEQPLRGGDHLPTRSSTTSTRHPSPEVIAGFCPIHAPSTPFRWVVGPDFAATPLVGAYRVIDPSNRVGVRFQGAEIPVPIDPSRLSRPVAPGAIQVAGNQPIVLGVAGGTIGGYPHVGHVIAADLDRLAQLRPGDLVQFEQVDLSLARTLDQDLRQVRRRWERCLSVWADS